MGCYGMGKIINDEINYKDKVEMNLNNKFLLFPFISKKEIVKEVDKVYNNLTLSSNIINYNNIFMSYLIKDKYSNYELMLKLNELTKKINILNNKEYCQKEYELIDSLFESLNYKLYQNVIDEMIYSISDVNNFYDNTELLSYMQIDDKFYLKIANELRLGSDADNMETMLLVLDNRNLSINKLVKIAIIKYFENKYSDGLIDELVEEVLKTYNGNVSIIEHVKEVVKEVSISKKILVKSL